MKRTPDKDDTSITDIANVLLDPSANNKSTRNVRFSKTDNGHQSMENSKIGEENENLPFQEWTAKYRQ